MAAPVVVRFVVEGLDQVQSAFRKVEDAVVRGDRAASDSSARASRSRVSDAEREARAKRQILDREAREKIAAMKTGDKAIADAMKTATRETEKAAKDAVRLEQTAAREKARIAEAATREKSRQFAQLARESEKWAQDEIRTAKRAEDEKTRIMESAERSRRRFMSTVAGAGASGVRSGVNRVGGITAGIAGTALSLGGGFTVADALQGAMSVERNAALLSNSSYVPGRNLSPQWASKNDPARADPAKLAAHARATAIETGIDANEILEGTRTYVKRSSDLEGGMKNAKFFGKLSKATGADFGDVMNTAGRLRAQNPELDAAATQSMMMGIVAAGKLGSLEMSDMGANAGKMTKTRVAYAGDMAKNQATLLGLGQIAARSGGGAEDAATAVSNIADDALKHSKKIAGSTDKTGKLVAPEELIAKVFEQSGGDLAKIGSLGFGKRSMKVFEELKVAYDRGGGDVGKGVKNVRDEMAPVTNAKYDEASLNADFKAVIDTPAEQFANALRDLKESLGAQLLPEFVKLIPVIKDLGPVFVDLAKTSLPAFVDLIKSLAEFASANRGIIQDIAAHPIGALMAKEVGESIAKAALGELIKKLLTTAAGGGSGGGGGGAPGVTTPALATGVAAGAVVVNSEIGYAKGTDRAVDMQAKVEAYMRGVRGENEMSPEAAQKEIDEAKARLEKGSVLGHAADLAASPFSEASSKDYGQYKKDQAIVDNEKLAKAVADALKVGSLAKSLDENTKALNRAGSNGAPGPDHPTRNIGISQRYR